MSFEEDKKSCTKVIADNHGLENGVPPSVHFYLSINATATQRTADTMR